MAAQLPTRETATGPNWRRSVIVVDYEWCSSTGFIAWSSVIYNVRKQNRNRRWNADTQVD